MNTAVIGILVALAEHAPSIIKELEAAKNDATGNAAAADKAKAVLGDVAKLIGTLVEVL